MTYASQIAHPVGATDVLQSEGCTGLEGGKKCHTTDSHAWTEPHSQTRLRQRQLHLLFSSMQTAVAFVHGLTSIFFAVKPIVLGLCLSNLQRPRKLSALTKCSNWCAQK